MLGTLSIVFGVHTLFTKLVVAQRTLERDIIDHWDQTVTTFCRAHLQVGIIRGEVEFSDLFDQVLLPVWQWLIKQGFLVHFDTLTVLLRTFWRNKWVQLVLNIQFKAMTTVLMLAWVKFDHLWYPTFVHTNRTFDLLLDNHAFDVLNDAIALRGGFSLSLKRSFRTGLGVLSIFCSFWWVNFFMQWRRRFNVLGFLWLRNLFRVFLKCEQIADGFLNILEIHWIDFILF